MRVYEAVAEALGAEGVRRIFGVMGDGNMALWSTLLANHTESVLSARNEAGAVAMADGFFRATNDVGVATVTCGPGLTQVGTSLIAAARNRSSLLLICGEIPAHSINPLQSMDQRRFVEACETHYRSISRGGAIEHEIMEAFHLARRDRRPVVLNLPNDLQEAEVPAGWRYRPSREILPVEPREPSAADVDRLVAALAAAERPLLLAGRGARLAVARDEIVALGARIGALLGTTLQAKGFFPPSDRSIGIVGGYSSAETERLCNEADLVVAIGAEVGHYTSWGGTLFADARLIRIDDRPPERTVSRRAQTLIVSDAGKTMRAVNDRLAGSGHRAAGWEGRVPEIAKGETGWLPASTMEVDPRRLARRIGEALEPGTRLVCGVGHFQGFVATYASIGEGVVPEFVGQFGAIGQTLPVAIGMGMADRSRRIVCVEGDGSLWMNLQELDTAVRSGVAITLVVWNDGGYGAEFHRLPLKGFAPAPAQWERADFAALARSLGGLGTTIRRLDEFGPVWAEASRSDGLFVLDVHVDPREASDSYRKLYRGEPNPTPFLS